MIPTLYFQTNFYVKLLGVWAVAWLLPAEFKFLGLHLGREAFQTPFTSGLRLPKYHKFHWEILFELIFVYIRPSGELVCAFCLF